MITTETLVTIIIAICGSSGVWGLIMYLVQHHHKKLEEALLRDNAEIRMIKGIGHAQIIKLCRHYLAQKYITPEQYKDLTEHLYLPYKDLGGNGTVEKLIKEVDKLPVKEEA